MSKHRDDEYLGKLLNPSSLLEHNSKENYFKDFSLGESEQFQKDFLSQQSPDICISIVNHIYLAGYTLPASVCQIYQDKLLQEMLTCLFGDNMMFRKYTYLSWGDTILALIIIPDKTKLLDKISPDKPGTVGEAVRKLLNKLVTNQTKNDVLECSSVTKYNAINLIAAFQTQIFSPHTSNINSKDRYRTSEDNSRFTIFCINKPIAISAEQYIAPSYLRHLFVAFLVASENPTFTLTEDHIFLAYFALETVCFLSLAKLWLFILDLKPEFVVLIVSFLHTKKFLLSDEIKARYCKALKDLPANQISTDILMIANQFLISESDKAILSGILEKQVAALSHAAEKIALVNMVNTYVPLSDQVKQYYCAALSLELTPTGNWEKFVGCERKIDAQKAEAVLGQKQWRDTYNAALVNYIKTLSIAHAIASLNEAILDPDNIKTDTVKKHVRDTLDASVSVKKYEEAIGLLRDEPLKSLPTGWQLPTIEVILELYIDDLLSRKQFRTAIDVSKKYYSHDKEKLSMFTSKIIVQYAEYCMLPTTGAGDSSKNITAFKKICITAIDEHIVDDKKREQLKNSVQEACESCYEKFVTKTFTNNKPEIGTDVFDKKIEAIVTEYATDHSKAETLLFTAYIAYEHEHNYKKTYELLNTVACAEEDDDENFTRADIDKARFGIYERIATGYFKPCMRNGVFYMDTIRSMEELSHNPTPEQVQQRAIYGLEYLRNNTYKYAIAMLPKCIAQANGHDKLQSAAGTWDETALTPKAELKVDAWEAEKYNRVSRHMLAKIDALEATIVKRDEQFTALTQTFQTLFAQQNARIEKLLASQPQQVNNQDPAPVPFFSPAK